MFAGVVGKVAKICILHHVFTGIRDSRVSLLAWKIEVYTTPGLFWAIVSLVGMSDTEKSLNNLRPANATSEACCVGSGRRLVMAGRGKRGKMMSEFRELARREPGNAERKEQENRHYIEPYAKVRPAPSMRQKRAQNAHLLHVNSAFSPVFAGLKGTIQTFA